MVRGLAVAGRGCGGIWMSKFIMSYGVVLEVKMDIRRTGRWKTRIYGLKR